MATQTTLTSSCLCGACHFSTSVDSSTLPLEAELCHCDSCRHASGTLAIGAVTWPGVMPDVSAMSKYAFSRNVDIYFCGTCGTLLVFHRHDGSYLGVTAGTLDDGGQQVRLTGHMFLMDTKDGGCGSWLRDVGGVEQARYVGHVGSEKLSAEWPGERTEEGRQDEEVVANCLCKGVEFKMTRPNQESREQILKRAKEENSVAMDILAMDENKYRAALCVCDSCRLAAGVDIAAWAYVPLINIKMVNGEDHRYDFGTLKSYRSSNRATRYFCEKCSSTVFWAGDEVPDVIDVAVGLLNSKSGARAEDWLRWDTSEISWEEEGPNKALVKALSEGLEKYEKERQSQKS